MGSSGSDTWTDERISIGRRTYGLKRSSFLLYEPDESVAVGSFCSFGPGVLLLGGGEHRVGVSSYPLHTRLLRTRPKVVEALSKGPVQIGNDCWFGTRSMVLSGVTVGHGAIVGAGAVVARDVPPYAVVAGNPAQVVRMRFDERTVERLLAVAWWNWDDETIRRRAHLFDDVEQLLRAAEQDAGAPPVAEPASQPTLADRYLDVLRDALVGRLSRGGTRYVRVDEHGDVQPMEAGPEVEKPFPDGWPDADTMVGVRRLDNVRACVEDVLARGVPGDLIETGVWRGGTTVFMRGILAAHGDTERRVWVADSFQGLPAPDPGRYPLDAGDGLHKVDFLAVSEDEVRAVFSRYGLLDEQVRFVPGWFRDTLPPLARERFAVVRLDGDMYESTIVALESLYPALSPGGYLIVDDYALESTRAAVTDFRKRNDIRDPIERVDWTGAFWCKAR